MLWKHYASTEKCNFWSLLLFYGFFENFIDCSQYPSWSNVYSDLPITDICHQLKTIHNTTKYPPYLRWSPSETSKCPMKMNICAFLTNKCTKWSGRLYFHKSLLVVEDYTEDGWINMEWISVKWPFWRRFPLTWRE